MEPVDGSLAPGVLGAAAPTISPELAATIAERFFDLAGEATELASERDQNFLIEAGDGGAAVLKISNAAESPAVLDMETGAALHALEVDPGLPVAAPLVPVREGTGAGGRRIAFETASGESHWVRLFERVPGTASFDPARLDPAALSEFGSMVARVGRALRSYFHPAASRVLLWDVQHASRLRPLIGSIEGEQRRALAGRVLDSFERRAAPLLPGIRHQVIHGDLSADNTTIDERGRVIGVIDFGDASFAPLACDISSAWASLAWVRRGEELFEAALSLLDGYSRITPLEPDEMRVLGDLFAARGLAAAAIAADRLRGDADNAYVAGFDEHAWPLLELYDEIGAEEFGRRLGLREHGRQISLDRLTERRARAFGAAISPPTYSQPLQIAEASGVWMTDASGRRYLDAYNNVPVLGHSHPRVVAAISRQSRELNTNMRYLHPAAIELGERLVSTMPPDSGLDTVMLVNSGSEANDLAWRLARCWSGRHGAVVSDFAYHGISDAVARLSPEGWGTRPDDVETFDPTPRGPGLEAGVRGAMERLRAPAALVMVDPAFTSDGVHPARGPDLAAAAQACREDGALYAADEVQLGYGRSGEHLWGFAAAGVQPDFVTLGKPMGNGFPVAALITRSEIAERFARETEFFSTFGGNPPAAVAALTVLDVIEDQHLIESAHRVGSMLADGLASISGGPIRQVRAQGLMIGVELEHGEGKAPLAVEIADRMRSEGVLVGVTGARRDTLKVRPPLVFGEHHVELLLEALRRSLAAAEAAQ